MDAEKLKLQIGANIASYRKRSGLTQAGLAEKLNYSDNHRSGLTGRSQRLARRNYPFPAGHGPGFRKGAKAQSQQKHHFGAVFPVGLVRCVAGLCGHLLF